MERPSFINILEKAHHFTIKNFGAFLPLVLKTILLWVLLVVGLAASMIVFGALTGLFEHQNTLHTSALSFLKSIHPLALVVAPVVFFIFIIGFWLTINPLYVSIYRRALLDEEIDHKYLGRIFAKRELNFFIAQLKIGSVFVGVFLIAAGLFATGIFVTISMQSMPLNILMGIIGFFAFFGFIALLLFLGARLSFVLPNVVLDRGSNLKTSIVQSRHYTLFLIGISVLVSIIAQIFQGALQEITRFITVSFMEPHIAAIINFIVCMIFIFIISYYVMLFIPSAVSYTYRAVVLKE